MTANDRKRRLQKAVTEFVLDGGWRAEAPGARLGRLIAPHARSNCTLPSACRPTINSPTTGSLCHPAGVGGVSLYLACLLLRSSDVRPRRSTF